MKTTIVDISGDTFPAVSVPIGGFVVWRNLDPHVHSAEKLPADSDYFNAGAMQPGELSTPIRFDSPGIHKYLCRFHAGMVGEIRVATDSADEKPKPSGIQSLSGEHGGGHGHGHGYDFRHYHGFVTGGRSGGRLFLTHTPVLADGRHCYQVILRAHFESSKHSALYDELRNSAYGDGVVQIFHDHVSMPDIGRGEIKKLPNASVSYWPGGSQTSIGPEQVDVVGLENVPIVLDEVLHFHQFAIDSPYPEALTYLMYGDDNDVFVDHFMDRAPSFHSVAKLASPPVGWKGAGVQQFEVPGRAIRDVPVRLMPRASIVDNAFHLYWLLPPGTLPRQYQDPLIVRDNRAGENHKHRIKWSGGGSSSVEISRFLHFDIRLLNYGVFIV